MLRKMYCTTERIVAINLSRDWKSYSNIEVYYLLFTSELYDCQQRSIENYFSERSQCSIEVGPALSSYVEKGEATGN